MNLLYSLQYLAAPGVWPQSPQLFVHMLANAHRRPPDSPTSYSGSIDLPFVDAPQREQASIAVFSAVGITRLI